MGAPAAHIPGRCRIPGLLVVRFGHCCQWTVGDDQISGGGNPATEGGRRLTPPHDKCLPRAHHCHRLGFTGCFQMRVKILANRTQVPGVARRSVPCAASSLQPRALASPARRDTSYPSLDSQPPPLLGPGLPTSYSYYFAFYKTK